MLPGVEKRFRALLRQIKAHPNYTPTIGVQLGIEAPSLSAPNYETLQPKITAQVIGDQVELGWDWQGHVRFWTCASFRWTGMTATVLCR